MEGNNIPENVLAFIDKCSVSIGECEREASNIRMWCECSDDIKSPIEQLLFCALYTIKLLNSSCFLHTHRCDNGETSYQGLIINPQYKIDKYRVDFLIEYVNISADNGGSKVVVECDSQEFHDRSEFERRYEKQRDRDLQSLGYKVFRFTGTEIFKDPMAVALEIVSFLTGVNKSDFITCSNIED